VAGCSQVSSSGCPEEAAIVKTSLFMRNPCNGTSILGVGIYIVVKTLVCGSIAIIYTTYDTIWDVNGTVVLLI
jgi:hypothetical protein